MQVASRQCLWRDTIAARGTVVAVEVSEDSMAVLLSTGTLAAGSKSVIVSWGDGSTGEYNGISGARHTYATPGEYLIVISDDIATFGFTNASGSMAERDTLRELVSLGEKVTSIAPYGFNNCKKMRGVMNLPNVTSIGSYAFGSTLGITDFILPSMTRLVQESFYSNPGPTQIHADNVRQIDSYFWEYYGYTLCDMYLRSSTCAQIKAMSGFPFKADRASQTVRFHGSDGIVTAGGDFTPN